MRYRNEYIEDLPENILSPSDPDYLLYKCRNNFFVGVMGWLDRLFREGVIVGERDLKKYREYVDFVKNKNKPRTTKEDIDYVNAILDYFINLLKSIA